MSDSNTTSQPPEYPPTKGMAVAGAIEAFGQRQVKELLELVVITSLEAGIWQWGDGYGGAIHEWLDAIADHHGVGKPKPVAATKRNPIGRTERRLVFERDAYRCVNCGSWESLVVDHIVALSNGGSDDESNLQTLCQPCNGSKGSKTQEEWEETR